MNTDQIGVRFNTAVAILYIILAGNAINVTASGAILAKTMYSLSIKRIGENLKVTLNG